MTFEQQVARLEAIVAQLNDSKLDLAQALKLFDEGVGLLRNAHEELSKVEGTLGRLIERADGSFDVVDK
ncbi:MAG: exodeoxyribonuclease VII small subunit [Gemmatimonadaceae bacterium]